MRCSPILILLATLTAGCAPRTPAPIALPAPTLVTERFGAAQPADTRTLIVVLHGDSPAAPPAEHLAAAPLFAGAVPGSVSVAVLRPGYADAAGRTSPGVRGTGLGDNYTPDRVAAVADAVATLRLGYPKARVILVGHSGGGAIAAGVAGTRIGLVDGLVVTGCPCMLEEWRRDIARHRPGSGWGEPVQSLDPIQMVGGISPMTRAAVLVGVNDAITPPPLSRGFAEALALRGVATDFRILPAKGHDILTDPETVAAVQRLAAALAARR